MCRVSVFFPINVERMKSGYYVGQCRVNRFLLLLLKKDQNMADSEP